MTDVPADIKRASIWREAAGDIAESLRLTPFWMALAFAQVRNRYNRQALGLLWQPLSYAFVVFALGYIFGEILNREPDFFLPYLAAGFATWAFISGALIQGSNAFIAGRRHILSRPTPLFMFSLQSAAVLAIQFLFEIPLFFVFALIVGREIGWVALLAIPGFALLLLNAVWVGLFLAVANARFPDIGQLVNNAMRILFLVTPVIWSIDINARIENVASWNPFFHALEMVRAPLMGSMPSMISYYVIGGAALAGFIVTFPIFALARRRVPYWV